MELIEEYAVLIGHDAGRLKTLLDVVLQGFADEAALYGVQVRLLDDPEARLQLDLPERPGVAVAALLEAAALDAPGAFDDLRSCALAYVVNPGEPWAVAELRRSGERTARDLLGRVGTQTVVGLRAYGLTGSRGGRGRASGRRPT